MFQEGSGRVRSQVSAVAEQEVAGWASLYTDVLFLHQVDKMWVHDKVESVANALRL